MLSQLGSRIAGEREFLFKHVLTRDVAYGTLARRDRARAHADVAAWIERAAGERQREFADLLAHHLGLAYEGAVADPAAPADRREELRLRFLEAALAASAEAQSRMLLDKANTFGEAALDVAVDAHERSLALEALGLSALREYRGDDSWRYYSQAVDERIAGGRGSGESLAMLCARAVESPTRWPASMELPPGLEDVRRYVEIGLEHADAEGEARVRLLIARSMWIFAFGREGFSEEDADASRRAGEEAFALAEALGRDDLASAALDGVQSIEFIVGLHGLTWPVVERRLEIVERLTDPWEIGDALQTAADTALAVGRIRGRAPLGERGLRACEGRPGRLARRPGVASDRPLQARRLGRSARGLRAHGGGTRCDALRNDRVLHADDVELHRAASRAPWRARGVRRLLPASTPNSPAARRQCG